MGNQRLPIVVGIAVIAGVAGWFVLRGGKSTESQTAEVKSDPATTSGSAAPIGKAAVFAPEGPALGSGAEGRRPVVLEDPQEPPARAANPVIPDPGSDPQNPVAALAAQQRDPSWAGPTEDEIRKRMGKLAGARLEGTECRHDRCMLTFRGSQDDLATAIAQVESPKGLYGYARSIYLTAPLEQSGKYIVRVYASFERE